MLKIGALTDQVARQTVRRHQIEILTFDAKGPPDTFDCGRTCGFIQRDPDLGFSNLAEVHTVLDSRLHHAFLEEANINRDRVKEIGLINDKACFFQTFGQTHGFAVDALRDGLQTFGAVEDRVETRHHSQQSLSCTDVRRRLFAADVLFARLQRQTVGTVAVRVDGHTNNPARHRALIGIAAGHIGRVRATKAHGHAKPLGRANCDIGPHRARFFQQAQRHRISGNNPKRLGLVQRLDRGREILQATIGAGILEDRAEHLFWVHILGLADDDFDPQRLCPGAHDSDVLRVAVFIDEKARGLRLGYTLRHGHRLGAGGGFIQQRRVGDLKTGQIGDHRLVVQQRLKTALRNFGLVGRVGRVPCRIFQNVPLDRRRRHGAVVALTDQRCDHVVLLGHLPHVPQQFALGHRLAEFQRRFLAD